MGVTFFVLCIWIGQGGLMFQWLFDAYILITRWHGGDVLCFMHLNKVAGKNLPTQRAWAERRPRRTEVTGLAGRLQDFSLSFFLSIRAVARSPLNAARFPRLRALALASAAWLAQCLTRRVNSLQSRQNENIYSCKMWYYKNMRITPK
jgi:hypothetical protein